ncbi:MAG: hypothetical protein GF331_19145 [Chitinivibrionales bacterium]|nr:hypothetical protein [Chitinivibrionales bacterium]
MRAEVVALGPSVYYIDAADADPIPFELGGAIAFVDTFGIGGWPILNLAIETRTHREFVKNYADEPPEPFYRAIYANLKEESAKESFSELQWHWGLEALFLETVAIRSGFLFDWIGHRYEWTVGLGFRIFNHIQLDLSRIIAPEGAWARHVQVFDESRFGSSGLRDGQWRISVTAFRLGCWTRDDFIPLNLEKNPHFPRPGGS